MKKNGFVLSVFILSLFISISISAQEHGKIFSKNEADSLFGKVISSESISIEVLNSTLQKTEKVIMFRLKNNNLIILGDERTLIYNTNDFTDNNEVFHLFSKGKVEKLVELGLSSNNIVEQRDEKLTITNGNYTLEMSIPCPPYCN